MQILYIATLLTSTQREREGGREGGEKEKEKEKARKRNTNEASYIKKWYNVTTHNCPIKGFFKKNTQCCTLTSKFVY